MLYEEIQQKYRAGEPIFIEDMLNGKDDATQKGIRVGFSQLVKKNMLRRFSQGIYYLPKLSSLLNREIKPSSEQVIIQKFIRRNGQVNGYFSGQTLANLAGISTQVPVIKEIVTNSESSRGRMVRIGFTTARVRKPKEQISAQNEKAMMLLDLLTDADKYSEYDKGETSKRIKQFAKKMGISKEKTLRCLDVFPSKTSKRLILSGVYDVLA